MSHTYICLLCLFGRHISEETATFFLLSTGNSSAFLALAVVGEILNSDKEEMEQMKCVPSLLVQVHQCCQVHNCTGLNADINLGSCDFFPLIVLLDSYTTTAH